MNTNFRFEPRILMMQFPSVDVFNRPSFSYSSSSSRCLFSTINHEMADCFLTAEGRQPLATSTTFISICDLVSCDLVSCYLVSCDLVSYDLVSCDLVSYDLVSCDLVSCDLVSCDLVSCVLMELLERCSFWHRHFFLLHTLVDTTHPLGLAIQFSTASNEFSIGIKYCISIIYIYVIRSVLKHLRGSYQLHSLTNRRELTVVFTYKYYKKIQDLFSFLFQIFVHCRSILFVVSRNSRICQTARPIRVRPVNSVWSWKWRFPGRCWPESRI